MPTSFRETFRNSSCADCAGVAGGKRVHGQRGFGRRGWRLLGWAWLLTGFLAWPVDAFGRSFCVNYAVAPDPADLLAFDLCILDPQTKADLQPGHQLGRQYLAYLSVVEVAPGAGYLKELEAAGISLVSDNPQWKSRCVDLLHPHWAQFVSQKLAAPALAKGFDGLFLDTVDAWQRLAQLHPDKKSEYAQALVALVKKLRADFPGKELVVNRGFDLLGDLQGSVDGVLMESVFRTFDPAGNYVPTRGEDNQALLGKIRDIRRSGLPVYVVDYLPRGNPGLAEAIVDQIRRAGAEPFLTTKELNGVLVAPVTREARRVLVIYGSVLAESEVAEKFAADSFTAERLQMPLEWLGYEVEYLNVGKVSPPAIMDERFCGVIFDVETQLPYGGEAWYVDWILEQKRRGLKVLFTGQYPFQQDVQRARLLKNLGLWGTFAQVPKPERVELKRVNRDLMSYEATLTAHPAEIEDSRAPEGAQIDVSVECTDEAANKLLFDAVFTCDWGGALMEPYATFQASAEDQASLFDPFKFLHRIFPSGKFPAPDTSTRDGRRIFYSHIDGDGFCGVTPYAGKAICGAIIRDRILKKYPFPITASLVEASMRGMEIGQEAKEVPMYEEVARSCFALPNVQAASHSFSHPYVWIDHDDEFIPLYESRGLELKPEVRYDVEKPDMNREIRGSIEYIQKLCPPGKKVDLMLWSGNCRPSPEALRLCQTLGVENMNGGNTVISKRHPFVSNISPRIMQWDGELQIHAANQNEFVYTKNWTGPFFGGFANVIETFKETEEPRRLKAVNIYYHFYSAATLGAMKALEKVHDWCLDQPLHSMTAVDYARLVRDSYQTRVYRQGAKSWLLVNQGHQRTFRLDTSAGVPDLTTSDGIVGYTQYKNWTFVHTGGNAVSRLVLAESPPRHLHLESSQGEITWRELGPARATFSVQELRPRHETILAGLEPGRSWQVRINGQATLQNADDAGRLILQLSGNAEVTVEPQSAEANAR